MPVNDTRRHYRRILLKLSGEALMGDQSFGIDPSVLETVATEISDIHKLGVEIGIVIGGGNIFRGLQSEAFGVERVAGDHMGMLATVINSIALGEVLKKIGLESRVMSALDIHRVAESYDRGQAIKHLSKKRIVIFGAGTGNPYFTTDTAATLRALETDAEVLMKATNVDGVYDADPKLEPSAKPFSELTYGEVLGKNLKVMDLTAVSLAMGQQLPIIVFNLGGAGNIMKAVSGEKVGTLIRGEQ
jgi:uridylate kinase